MFPNNYRKTIAVLLLILLKIRELFNFPSIDLNNAIDFFMLNREIDAKAVTKFNNSYASLLESFSLDKDFK